MSLELIAVILVIALFLLLAIGFEIAFAMAMLASVGFVFIISHPQVQIAWSGWEVMNSFTLIAMPLFIFMGQMFAQTGVISSLFTAANRWIGVLPGGLANSVIAACAIFGAMSGSSIAASATFSSIAFPEMEKRHYSNSLSFGAIAVGGTIAVLIPPSIIFIIYGAWESLSIARLFAAGMVPGIILSSMLMLTVMIWVKVKPGAAPKPESFSWGERFAAIKDVLPWMGLIVLVLGVIFGGVMTPTEASAMGAFLSILMAVAYRKFSFEALKTSALNAVRVASMVGFVMIGARLLAFVVQNAGLTDSFVKFMLSLEIGKYGTLTLLMIMYLILGCFFDAAAMLLLTTPFVMPIILGLHLDPIWWGVVYVILAEVSFVTPPFGLNLFSIHGVLPQYSIITIAKGTLPFLIPLFITIWLLILFPQLALWLPELLY
jgi:tripartite ATP-independent transporter DctM subunit